VSEDRAAELPLREALALGALHGPAELLPISSSGHVALVPWLAGWAYQELDADLRKAFEVALHAGTAAALLIGLRDEVEEAARGLDRRRLQLIVLSFAPAGALAFLLEKPIERHLGTPATTAFGLAVGALAMALADGRPQRRARDESTATDALALGLAQACAQRRDARGGALARLHARGRERALAPRGAAADRRRDRAEGRAAAAPRPAAAAARRVRARRGRVVRLDARLDVADPPGRARPLAGAVRRLPARARRARRAAAAARRLTRAPQSAPLRADHRGDSRCPRVPTARRHA
jgi:undecaprenyl-diphosphatase